MKAVTADQMRRIDRETIEQRGVPGSELMARAGAAIAREALRHFHPGSVAVVTGKGNNAGDGFVAARELHAAGVRVELCALRPEGELRGDALGAFRRLPPEISCTPVSDPHALRDRLREFDLIIDAIFGTGVRGCIEGDWAAA